MTDESNARDDRGLVAALVDDGRPLLVLTAMALLASGAFAVFLAVRREFLPHDVAFLGMTATELCAIAECRIVGFMFHDRVAFGGTLIAIAILYLWLALFPLRQRLAWAWWSFFASGVLGFGSFLAYLSYGYLDSWHGTATLFLLPLFIGGLILTRPLAVSPAAGWLTSDEGRRASTAMRERARKYSPSPAEAAAMRPEMSTRCGLLRAISAKPARSATFASISPDTVTEA